jgi:RED-like protein N-terminal region
MNNDAFRELVQQGGKTTKEIAREAVEKEFQFKKKRRRGTASGDVDSSDDDDNDKDRNKRNKVDDITPNDTKYNRNKAAQHPPYDNDDQGTNHADNNKYRDRARERREGKTDVDFAPLTAEGVDAEMSKFLGGDEAHTHLVKGLDVTLARKVKREMGKLIDQNTDLTTVLLKKAQEKKANHQLKVESTVIVESAAEAKEKIKHWTPDDMKSTLGRGMLEFLKQTYLRQPSSGPLKVSPAGLTIQRSTLTFSCQAHPGDVRKAWEVPEEHISMAKRNDDDRNNGGLFSAPDLLTKIELAFRRARSRQPVLLPTTQPLNASTTADTSDHKGTTGKDGRDGEDDSDDDIFADAGDYVPSLAGTTSSAASPAIKGSTFSGLLPIQNDKEEEQTQDFNFVAKLARKTRANAAAPRGGNFSHFDGDYGDDSMDVDFAGQMEDGDEEEHGSKKKKKSQEESTMASREYGKRGKPLRGAASDDD